MSPLLVLRDDLLECDDDDIGCSRSPWQVWGRWVAFAAIIIIVISFTFLFSHQSNRSRHNHELPPMSGTESIPPKYGSPEQQQQNDDANQNYNSPPVPPYPQYYGSPAAGQQPTGASLHESDTYYGNNGSQTKVSS